VQRLHLGEAREQQLEFRTRHVGRVRHRREIAAKDKCECLGEERPVLTRLLQLLARDFVTTQNDLWREKI
jgi:hypothetical protein